MYGTDRRGGTPSRYREGRHFRDEGVPSSTPRDGVKGIGCVNGGARNLGRSPKERRKEKTQGHPRLPTPPWRPVQRKGLHRSSRTRAPPRWRLDPPRTTPTPGESSVLGPTGHPGTGVWTGRPLPGSGGVGRQVGGGGDSGRRPGPGRGHTLLRDNGGDLWRQSRPLAYPGTQAESCLD